MFKQHFEELDSCLRLGFFAIVNCMCRYNTCRRCAVLRHWYIYIVRRDAVYNSDCCIDSFHSCALLVVECCISREYVSLIVQ